jgi:glycosyltransferase involved in cell wall biosynthesis
MTPSIESVSVVIAAYNESAAIGQVVAGCAAETPNCLEILVVDDGSSDDTAQVAAAAGARVIRSAGNRGKGHALRMGMDAARGDVIVVLDGDGQDEPSDVRTLLAAMASDVDMVIGSRFLGTFEAGAITPLNRLGTRALTGVLNALFGTRVTDPIAGFRAIRRERLAACELRAARYDIEVDVLLALLRAGGRVVEVPVVRRPRPYGESRLHPFKDGFRILRCIVTHRVRSGRASAARP